MMAYTNFSLKKPRRAMLAPLPGGTTTMTEAKSMAYHETRGDHACYDCGEATSLSELAFVDDLIEHLPFFKGISENFSHCDGDDTLFHGNIVNYRPRRSLVSRRYRATPLLWYSGTRLLANLNEMLL